MLMGGALPHSDFVQTATLYSASLRPDSAHMSTRCWRQDLHVRRSYGSIPVSDLPLTSLRTSRLLRPGIILHYMPSFMQARPTQRRGALQYASLGIETCEPRALSLLLRRQLLAGAICGGGAGWWRGCDGASLVRLEPPIQSVSMISVISAPTDPLEWLQPAFELVLIST